MKMFSEFLELHKELKRDRARMSKIKKPTVPHYSDMPHLQLEVSKMISKITGIDPYEIQDLIRYGEWDNPIVHQPILDLFMGLRLTYQGEKSYDRKRAEEILKDNRTRQLKYEEKLAEYQEGVRLRNKPTDPKLIEWFRDTRVEISNKILNDTPLSFEEKLIIQAIASEYNQMVVINDEYQPAVIHAISPSTDDVIRIMRRARRLYSETPVDAHS